MVVLGRKPGGAGGGGGPPSGAAGGALGGTYPNPSLASQNLTDIAALADPGADRILFWDDSAGVLTWLTAGTNLTITATTIDAAGGGGTDLGYARSFLMGG